MYFYVCNPFSFPTHFLKKPYKIIICIDGQRCTLYDNNKTKKNRIDLCKEQTF